MPPTYYFELESDDSIHTDIYYSFKDAPKIGSIVEHEGKRWRRMPTMPCAASDTQINENSASEFVRKTGQMKGTYGQMLDYSAEMSEKRAAKNNGIDPIAERYYEKHKATTGLEHHVVKKRKAKENLAKKGIILE
jgi:hypothetical protein